MSETTKYSGGCQCGAVRFSVTIALGPVIACNCSMCGRSGTLLAFVPASQFELLQGEDMLTDYQFNKKTIHHLFCRVCGIKPFARGQMPDGSPMVAVNARCLDGVDVSMLEIQHYDGAHA